MTAFTDREMFSNEDAITGVRQQQTVVNSRCESHDVENLLICDASVFPTSCGANPMISIMTLARYHGRRIASELGRYGLG